MKLRTDRDKNRFSLGGVLNSSFSPHGKWLGIIILFEIGLSLPRALAQSCREPAKEMARLELFFGMGSPRRPISAARFAHFLAKEVTPKFPKGLSLFDGYGEWRSPVGRLTKEHSKLLLIYYEPDAGSEAKIEAIRDAYKHSFHQLSVLRADSFTCVRF